MDHEWLTEKFRFNLTDSSKEDWHDKSDANGPFKRMICPQSTEWIMVGRVEAEMFA